MAKFKKYSMKFMCIVSVVFTFMTALFYPVCEFEAAILTIMQDYNYPNQSFPSIHATLYEASEGVISISDYSLISKAYNFLRNDGTPYVTSSNCKFRFSGYFSVTESNKLTTDFGSSSDVVENVVYSTQYYVMFGGEEIPCYSLDGITYWFVFEIMGSDFSYFDLKCEVDALVDFDFLIDEYGIPDSVNYRFTSTVSDFHFTLMEISGVDILDPDQDIFYDVIDYGNSLLSDLIDLQNTSNNISQSILDKLTEYFNMSGDETLDDVPTDDLTDLGDKEDDLLDSTTPDDAADNLDVSIDADSSAVIWDIINDVVTSNDIVFSGFISLLSLGVIALILNR